MFPVLVSTPIVTYISITKQTLHWCQLWFTFIGLENFCVKVSDCISINRCTYLSYYDHLHLFHVNMTKKIESKPCSKENRVHVLKRSSGSLSAKLVFKINQEMSIFVSLCLQFILTPIVYHTCALIKALAFCLGRRYCVLRRCRLTRVVLYFIIRFIIFGIVYWF